MRVSLRNETELEEFMSRPTPRVVEFMKGLTGDIVLLGIAGKIGITLGMMAARAIAAAGTKQTVYGVSRFSDPASRERLEKAGIRTIQCDLVDPDQIAKLPEAPNVIFLAGKKFGTTGAQDQTWAMNTVVPANVAQRYSKSRIVVYSTGCVYKFMSPASGGAVETDDPGPLGEYAQSTLGRERVFEYYSRKNGTPMCLFRLNYAIDLRYGVLCDIAAKLIAGTPIDLSTGTFNCIWQGDVLERTILCLDVCESPPVPLNVSGPETVSVRWATNALAVKLGRKPSFINEDKEGNPSYLGNPAKSFSLFGYPRVCLHEMVEMVAEWVGKGGSSLGKPTHFEQTDGKY